MGSGDFSGRSSDLSPWSMTMSTRGALLVFVGLVAAAGLVLSSIALAAGVQAPERERNGRAHPRSMGGQRAARSAATRFSNAASASAICLVHASPFNSGCGISPALIPATLPSNIACGCPTR